DEELISMGEEEFSKYCAACHQADGQGIPNAYPALARNGFVLAEDPSGVLRVIFTGRAGMPHFREALSAQQIAAIVSYIRNSWENEASTVSAEQVRTVEEEIYSPSEPMEHDGSSE
ncbi:MAG: cytochrome c, partial [Caldilineaceae bacterium]|nr:cytochrome c [Caldilineaceae bacterium]